MYFLDLQLDCVTFALAVDSSFVLRAWCLSSISHHSSTSSSEDIDRVLCEVCGQIEARCSASKQLFLVVMVMPARKFGASFFLRYATFVLEHQLLYGFFHDSRSQESWVSLLVWALPYRPDHIDFESRVERVREKMDFLTEIKTPSQKIRQITLPLSSSTNTTMNTCLSMFNQT